MGPDRRVVLAEALAEARVACCSAVSTDSLTPLPAAGVAHDHWAIAGTDCLLRVPRLSQSGHAARVNLAYQAACFERAQASGVTPRLHGIVPVSERLAMGALVVDRIDGGAVRLPDDLPAMAACLAAIHSLPVPDERQPLATHDDPVASLIAIIADQAEWLDRAGLPDRSVAIIREQIGHARSLPRPPESADVRCLIVADCHPGNYLVDRTGKAWFVDLEKAAYSHPAIDVVHATLPTSIGWDARISGTATAQNVAAFEAAYLAALTPSLRPAVQPWLAPVRRLVWLRTVTWFARWRARSTRAGDPWSAADLPSALRNHMRAHVDASLSPSALEAVRDSLG